MAMPGFTGVAALKADTAQYRTTWTYAALERSVILPQLQPGCRRAAGNCTGIGGRSTTSLEGRTQTCGGWFQYPYIEICREPWSGFDSIAQGCNPCAW